MKKYLIAMLLGLVLILALATTIALADNGPHGGFAANTDACAGCHRLHSAQVGSNELLKASDVEALCESCHGATGTGAYTNVVDGVYKTGGTEGLDGGSLLAGGFDNASMTTAWTGKTDFDPDIEVTSKATTSKHNVGASGTIWGSGANNSANGSLVLECTSCHDPHGTAGWDVSTTPDTRVASYRLLRWQPSGSNGFTAPAGTNNWSGGAFPSNDASTPVSGWLVPDNYATIGTEWYTIGQETLNGSGPFAAGDYNNGNANNTYQPFNTTSDLIQNYIPAAINEAYFCAQCHDRYFNNSRLRNDTDASLFCGAPYDNMYSNGVLLPLKAPVAGLHPTDPDRCIPVLDSTTGALLSWGDSGSSGDTVYTYRHTSGDIRVSTDGTNAAGAGTSVSRACAACHVAHGTSSNPDPAPGNGVDAGTAGVGSLAGGSILLRMDGRTVCLRCHASSVNFTTTTGGTYDTPVVTSVDVASGTEAGGTTVIVTGSNFYGTGGVGVSSVQFGSFTSYSMVPLLGSTKGTCQQLSDTQVKCLTAPVSITANTSVKISVTITGSKKGTSGGNLFTFNNDVTPGTVTNVAPNTGSRTGGTPFTITGTGFYGGGSSSIISAVNMTLFTDSTKKVSYSMVTVAPTWGQCQVTSDTTMVCVSKTTTTAAGWYKVVVSFAPGGDVAFGDGSTTGFNYTP